MWSGQVGALIGRANDRAPQHTCCAGFITPRNSAHLAKTRLLHGLTFITANIARLFRRPNRELNEWS